MTQSVTIPEPEALPKAEPAAPSSAGEARPRPVDSWFAAHPDALAAVILAAGLGLRLYVAAGSYLNPDEAIHYVLVHQPSLFAAYKASLTNAHPPLIYVILYFWQFLGHSELMLRLPSVLAGTAFCWVLYKWVNTLFGRAASLAAIILGAFSPSLISLSAQVRAYAVMLVCVAGALYFLERALQDVSVREIWLFSACLYLAILSHYSVAFFTLAVGVYALARIIEARPKWSFIAAWAAGQAIAAAIYAALYFTHVSKIKPGEMEQWANPHENAFFHGGSESLAAFTLRKSGAIFRFLFLEDYIYWGLLAVFAGAVVLLFFNASIARKAPLRRWWPVALLLLIPFVAEWGGALARVYPYTGSRQSVFLAPFVFAALGAAFARLSEEKLWPPMFIAGLIVLAGQVSPVRFEPYFSTADSSASQMASAMKYVRATVPQNEAILADLQSSVLLSYYLCDRGNIYLPATPSSQFVQSRCGGYSVISTGDQTWKFTPDNFAARFAQAAAMYQLKPNDTVWVFQSGWGANLNTELPWFILKYRCLVSQNFGANITVIPFTVGADLSPALPQGSPHLSRMNRCVP